MTELDRKRRARRRLAWKSPSCRMIRSDVLGESKRFRRLSCPVGVESKPCGAAEAKQNQNERVDFFSFSSSAFLFINIYCFKQHPFLDYKLPFQSRQTACPSILPSISTNGLQPQKMVRALYQLTSSNQSITTNKHLLPSQCKHILNAQVSVRSPCCKKWFDVSPSVFRVVLHQAHQLR